MPAKKKKTTKKKTSKKDPIAEQIGRLQPKLKEGLEQARDIVSTHFASVDSVFRHRLECATQRAGMETSGPGYIAFQALLELFRKINLLTVPLDCTDLATEFEKLDRPA